MKPLTSGHLASCALALAVLTSSLASAQFSAEKVRATDKILQQVKSTISKLPFSHQQALSGYAKIAHLADVWQAYGMRLTDPSFISRATPASNGASVTGGIIRVSNPAYDLAYSSFGGFTQSTTSTARCGNNVVVGFNDSGSVFETPFFSTGTGGESTTGASYSTNGGASFTDIGPISPGPETGNFLGGDPIVTCSDPNMFYFSQIFDYDDGSGNPWAAVAINTSTDGGKTWSDPIAAIAKSADYHVLDKPWSAVDPSDHKRIFVSYTDFDNSETNACGTNYPIRTAIEFVESKDGGATWSTTPYVVMQVCGSAQVQDSQLAVSSTGTLYIAWMNLGSNFPTGMRAIQSASFSHGKLSAPVTVDSAVQPGGDSYYLQGDFRDIQDMAMAIDHSGTATDGALYITWADGRDKIVPDPLALQGFYAYDDIFLRASFDGGNTWGSTPTRVNSDTQPRLGSGRDHYQSGVAVDNRGYVAVCWYDRRADVENFAIRRHCAESSNQAASFSDADIGLSPFAPTHGGDLLENPVYMGDYDQLTSDFLNRTPGFIGAFQNQGYRGNPDVYAHPMN
jgi:hypothetical protein